MRSNAKVRLMEHCITKCAGAKAWVSDPSCPLRNGAGGEKMLTSGVTEPSRVRVPIDHEACFLDVGSSYPGLAAGAKGTSVRRLKRHVSWVKDVVKQFVFFLLGLQGN